MNLNTFESKLNKGKYTEQDVRKLLNYTFELQEESFNLEENNKLLENGSNQLLDEIKMLINDRNVLVEILKELEFIKDTGRIGGEMLKFCPICKTVEGKQSHKDDCKLNNVLKYYKN